MMRRFISLIFVAMAVVLASCNKPEQKDSVPESFYAYTEQPESKTILDETGTHILWQQYDMINVFSGSASGSFTSSCDRPSSATTFSGGFQGQTESTYWAAYPYRDTTSFDGQSIRITIPDTQTATEGSFDKQAFVMMAKTDGNELYFRNLCGGIAVSVSGHQDNRITGIIIESNNGEYIAGTVVAEFNEKGEPVVKEIIDGKTSISLKPKSWGRLSQDNWYYIAALPQSLSQGYTVKFSCYTGNDFEKTYTKPVTIKRSIWGVINEVDINAPLVPFTDLNFFYYCRQDRDADGDYVISIEEAKNIASISCSGRDINSLADLIYFPNLQSLHCENNNLTELDVRANSKIQSINCYGNKISELKIDGLLKLFSLDCRNNQLTALDVSDFPNMNSLYCSGNPGLTDIWVSTDQTFRKLVYDSSVSTLHYAGAKSIKLNKTELVLVPGQKYRLRATVEAEREKDKAVSWSSSDESIAFVDDKGLVRALKVGQATITATAKGKTASCDIVVKNVNPDDDQGDISFEDWDEGITIDF